MAESPRAALLLPFALARVSADLERALFATAGSSVVRPRTAHPTSLCDQVAAPHIDEPIERFVHQPPGDLDSPWFLELAGPTAKRRPGPVESSPSTSAQQPMRLVLRSTPEPSRVDVTIESGGWLLCALPTVQLTADGKSVPQLEYERTERRSNALDVGVNVDANGARISLQLPADLVRSLLAAEQLEVGWDGGRVVLHPQQHEAIRSVVEHLRHVHEAQALPTGPGLGAVGAGGPPLTSE